MAVGIEKVRGKFQRVAPGRLHNQCDRKQVRVDQFRHLAIAIGVGIAGREAGIDVVIFSRSFFELIARLLHQGQCIVADGQIAVGRPEDWIDKLEQVGSRDFFRRPAVAGPRPGTGGADRQARGGALEELAAVDGVAHGPARCERRGDCHAAN